MKDAFIKNVKEGAGEMTRRLTSLSALPVHPGWIPSIHHVKLTCDTHTYMQTLTNIHKIKAK